MARPRGARVIITAMAAFCNRLRAIASAAGTVDARTKVSTCTDWSTQNGRIIGHAHEPLLDAGVRLCSFDYGSPEWWPRLFPNIQTRCFSFIELHRNISTDHDAKTIADEAEVF
jgi:hypothetical protein